MSISCGHCKNTHPTVGDVRACAAAQQFKSVEQAPKFTYSERRSGDLPSTRRESSEERMQRQNGHKVESSPSAYGVGQSRTSQEERESAQVPVKRRADEGMYRKSGTIYKVQKAVHGSKLNYAKRLTQVSGGKFRFEYARGFVFELRSEHKLSLEQAKEFGALYGSCCVCGRTLTRESSIAAGIGPVCATKF